MFDKEIIALFEFYFHERLEKYREAVNTILDNFKCRRCTWCCKEIPVQISIEEAEVISSVLGISLKKFIRKYTVVRNEALLKGLYLKTPCPLLKGSWCSIYSFRPEVCRFYPFKINAPILQAIDKCPLAKEINDVFVKLINKIKEDDETREEFLRFQEKIFKTYSPTSRIVGEVINRILDAKNLFKELNELNRNAGGDTLNMVTIIEFLQFLAYKLKKSRES